MTRLLPAKIGPIEGGMGHEKPSGSYIHRFVSFDIERICFSFLNWALPSRAAQ